MSARPKLGIGWVLALALFVPLAAFSPASAGSPQAPQAPGSNVYAAYVLLAESPAGPAVAFARVLVDSAAACPDLVDTAGHKIATTPRVNPDPKLFPVNVCEAVYPFGRAYAVAGGPQLPKVQGAPTSVAVFGDSGCKPKDQDGCTLSDPEWPLPALAKSAAANPPDLVLHVGDYNYRGTPSHYNDPSGNPVYYYDAGDGAPVSSNCGLNAPYISQNSSGSAQPDSWQAWWLDFFMPAHDLLAAAPWVFARGNHELCSHAGPGWFYFLDASSNLPQGGGKQLACPSQDGGGPALPHLQLSQPQVLKLGGLELLVIDSANACDQLPGLAQEYQKQLQAATLRLQGQNAWLVGHRPVWGIEGSAEPVYDCNNQLSTAPTLPFGQLNQTLQCALAGPTGDALLPRLDWILSGHMHRFETLTFAAPSKRPPTLVIGNSGVFEDTSPPSGAFAQTLDGGTATGFSLAEFGYLQLEKNVKGGWMGKILATDPAAWSPYLATCAATEGLCVEVLQ